MDNGYVKLWRKSLDSAVWDNPNIWRLWCYCLLKASYRENKVMVNFKEIELKPGQFVFGRERAAKELMVSRQTIYNWIKSGKLWKLDIGGVTFIPEAYIKNLIYGNKNQDHY